MTHEQAVATEAVLRYSCGEMPALEREAFEEHYFSCSTCGEEVRSTELFLANARAVFREEVQAGAPGMQLAEGQRTAGESSAAKEPGWWEWFRWKPAWGVAFAGVLVAWAVTGVWLVQSRQALETATAVQATPAFALQSLTRSSGQVVEIPGQARFVSLYFDVPVSGVAGEFSCVLRSEEQGEIARLTAAGPAPPSTMLHLQVPAALLVPGQFQLTVTENSSSASPQVFDFTVRRR
jgi:hypothetical protein